MSQPSAAPQSRPDPKVNFMYSLGYLFGFAMLMIPPVGILVLLIVHRKHKAYLKTFLNSGY